MTFAKMEGKPLKFVKRVMGEAKRLLSSQGLEDAKAGGYSFTLLDRDNLSKWSVRLNGLNKDGKLAKDLLKHKLEPSIDLEISLPDGFPLEPPFARVLYPQLTGGFVFAHGGICFEPLTAKGWAPAMTLPALAIAIQGIMDYGEVQVMGVGDRKARKIPQYTEEGARKDHNMIVTAHKGGEASTYGSLKNYGS
uniref:UBC core domain-containing protein n=1 Tax=Zooxanthella nutricula TaxID=1333877 RepID=A0A7S2QJ57_9DINO